ncbi:tetratricopeptide repeat protein [Nitrosovibrio sp. Nv17]|uniref:tetratricopeptide repeat protein n=1 Tax=Nitrosovibrio sp. Nv17 TaxID=1855339 RepID=UPI000908DED5|nr:tetratricopeptide repeat protein [Nitrosovibrio sp. Nv17]SFW16103.1 Tetratricopeptide repeat-containing protein [Nitrosovibrio sp. Nv17]
MSMPSFRMLAFLALAGAMASVSAKNAPSISGRCVPAFSQVDAEGNFQPSATCELPPGFFREIMSRVHALHARAGRSRAGKAHLVDAVNVLLDTLYATLGPGSAQERRFGQDALHLKRLVTDLVERDGARPDADLVSEAQQWKLRYDEFVDQLERARLPGPAARSIRASLHRLDLQKAAELLRSASRESAVEKPLLGARHFGLALVEMLRFRYRAALPDLEKAHALQPDDARIAFSLARILQDERRSAEAAAVYDRLLARYRALPEEGRQPYLADMAGILNNIGALHIHAREFQKAESAFGETLELYRALAQRNPYTYRPDMAMTLNNLGALYGESRRYKEAETAFREALELYQKLAQESPGTYRADVTMTLGNLESLYRLAQRSAGAPGPEREAGLPVMSEQLP